MVAKKKPSIISVFILIILFPFAQALGWDQGAYPARDFSNRWEKLKQGLLSKRALLENKGYTPKEILKKRLDLIRIPEKRRGVSINKISANASRDKAFFPTISFMDISDFQINQEEDSATFEQLLPSVFVFKDHSYLLVWEDERNGDWDLFCQKIDSSGAFVDTNTKIVSDSLFSDQIQPDLARIGDSSFVLVWIDGAELDLYLQLFNPDLTPITEKIEVSPSLCWSPKVSSFDDSTFVVVWKDESDDIYARRFNFSGIAFGPSFKVNDSSEEWRVSPSVDVYSDSGFVVVWEDYRDSDADIYFQRFNYSGSKIDTNILANSDLGDEDQYQPEVSFGKDGGFMISWVDTRNDNPDIYAKIFFWDGIVKKPDFKVNTDLGSDYQWDPCVGSYSEGKYVVCWTDLRDGWAIYNQIFDTAGTRVGINTMISDSSITGTREKVSLSVNQDGFYAVSWEDERNLHNDIYCQRVSDGSLLGMNLKLNLDSTGAMQNRPTLATDKDGNLIICWEDKRRGKSDIYLKKFNRWGTELFDDKKVNDNPLLVEQSSPNLAVSEDGDFVVVWEDQRNGLNIYAQLFDQFGNPDGDNFCVSSDPLFSFCTTPSVAKFWDGDFVVVWSAIKSGIRDVYAKRYNGDGTAKGLSFKVNDDNQDVDHINPEVETDSAGNFLVAWYDKRDSKKMIYLQRYDSSGAEIGDNFSLNADSTETDFDLGMNKKGDFVVVWKSLDSTEAIYAQIYDSSGSIFGGNILVTDDAMSYPESPEVYMDPDSYFVVVWTDYREGEPNIYYQIFEHNGTKTGANTRLNQPSYAIQMTPDVSLSMSYIYSAWVDNRITGHGFDIFAKTITYRTVNVDEENHKSLPASFELSQNYPNPFNPTTQIPFHVSGKGQGARGKPAIHTTLKIYNIRGQLVRTLVDEDLRSGKHKVKWDGKDYSNNEVSSGIYFYQLKTGEEKKTRKMVLVK